MSITAIIPAWNEGAEMKETINGLQSQTVPPAEIIVVANNCTDNTAEVARNSGARVIEIPECPGRKAQAINTAMREVLPTLTLDDLVFVQDGDTKVVPQFFERSLRLIEEGEAHVVCGRYAAPYSLNPLVVLQRNEFARDGRMTTRRNERTHILVGTSSLFPVPVLRAVVEARAAGELPGGPGAGYLHNEHSVTEDFDLTLALHKLGFRRGSADGADAVTDAMTGFRDLWKQRIRWARGGTEDIRAYGKNEVTRGFRMRRMITAFSFFALALFTATTCLQLAETGSVQIEPAWLILSGIFVVNQVVTVRSTGRLGMLYAALLLPDMIYNMFHQAVSVTAYVQARTSKKEAVWHET